MTSGILHVYYPSRYLNLFELLPPPQTRNTSTSTSTSTVSTHPIQPPKHVLLFIGGMYDTFNSPPYVSDLARLFPISPNNNAASHQPWRVMHVQLSSAGRAWGTSSLDKDIEEIAVAMDFIRTKLYSSPGVDIVLMGHSTGCQDIMRYLTASNPLRPNKGALLRPPVQGAILQAPVSDRDGVIGAINDEYAPEARKAYDAAMEIVAAMKEGSRRDVVLPMNLTKPLFGPTPISIERFLSLVSPESPGRPSAEDFFSHDLSDETFKETFGAIGKSGLLRASEPSASKTTTTDTSATTNTARSDGATEPALLVLMSDSDEHVRKDVSQKDLLDRWKRALSSESGCTLDADSEVILNAFHAVNGNDWPSQEARLVKLRAAVLNYLNRCVAGSVMAEAWDIWKQEREGVMTLKRNDGRKTEEQFGVLKL